ncbi:hypothetical protein NFI96_006813 [Prochilodus magdalenae]|nr:hypothetical protein NFI96_006813 [Prochilodus magdalenae]
MIESVLTSSITVWVFDSSIRERGYVALLSALKSNPSHLRELNLNYNDPGEPGVKLLSALLEDPHCKLETLHLSWCRITEEGCAALVSALKSNPSHLRELDLNYNNPGESGVKLLSDLLKDPHCKLEKLHFCEDSCISTKSQVRYSNNKPWFAAELKQLRREKEEAFRSGDRTVFKEAKYRLEKGIRAAKSKYSEQLNRHITANDPSSAWKGLQLLTGNKHQVVLVAPKDNLINHLSVSRLIIILDESNGCHDICKLQDLD